jgi:peptidase M23-like protein
VIVRTTNGYSLYAHMKDGADRVQFGQRIWPGDTIGQVGSTGARTTGNHLHYSVIKDGAEINHTNAGGSIGVNVDEGHTIDPATFDNSIPYADQTLRAERMFAPGTSANAQIGNRNPVASATPASPPSGLPSRDSDNSFNDRFLETGGLLCLAARPIRLTRCRAGCLD